MTAQQLAEVQSIIREATGYNATVAGGAVRDLILDRPIKDIDVFIPRSRDEEVWGDHEQRKDVGVIVTALGQIGGRGVYRTTSESFYTSSDEQVYATYEVDTQYGVVNLIFVSDLAEALNEFPDTLSQVYLTDDGDPDWSEEFEAIRMGLVPIRTYLLPDNPRVLRLKQKYGDFEWEHQPDHVWYDEKWGRWQ